jgi:hypothetical protein
VRTQETRLLLVDEAQLLFSSESARVNITALEWLKTFLNQSPCAVGFIGDKDLANCKTSNLSFGRRVEEEVEVEPYKWTEAAGCRELCGLISTLLHGVPGLPPDGLETMETAARIAVVNECKIGLISRLVIKAFELAFDAGDGRLTIAHLADALDCIDSTVKKTGQNIFRPVSK